MKLLLVDDDQSLRRVLQFKLEQYGFEVVAVEDGELAVRIAGVNRTLKKGERLLLNQEALGGEFSETDRLAALDTEQVALTDQQVASATHAKRRATEGQTEDDGQGKAAAKWAAGFGGIPNPLVIAAGVGVVVGGVIAVSNSSGSSDRNGSAN